MSAVLRRTRPPGWLRVLAALGAALLALVVPGGAVSPRGAVASGAAESTFQDDDHLLYASTATVKHVLAILKGLGVDRIRVTIKWAAIAPDPSTRTRPARFKATDPAAYPAANWQPYDRIVTLAQSRGIGVNFNLTDPGPLWAMRHDAPKLKEADHFAPNMREFEEFVYAVGIRYSGVYAPPVASPQPAAAPGVTVGTTTVPVPTPPVGTTTVPTTPVGTTTVPTTPVTGPTGAGISQSRTTTASNNPPQAATPLPAVRYWSVWNEPNIDGWLSPQWRRYHGRTVPNSPRLYRKYVDAAFVALASSGHAPSRDTILIGDLAPEGYDHPTAYPEMQPMPFLRSLYCVDGHYRPLRGDAAAAADCPRSGGGSRFVSAHPGLFTATGFAHHPYYFYFPPDYISDNTGFVPIGNLSRLEGGLDRVMRRYGVRRRLPIYLTEYGYQTNPPDPYQVVTPAQQAAYLNQADYIAWRDPRVRSVSQFLLYDAAPPYGATFQTGLLYLHGRRKPAFAAYRLPVFMPRTDTRRGGGLTLWGQLRPAPRRTSQTATIQFAPPGAGFRSAGAVHIPSSSREDYFTAIVHPPASGRYRIAWRARPGVVEHSRAIAVSVR